MGFFEEWLKDDVFEWFDKYEKAGIIFPHEKEYLRPAFNGDVDAAINLSFDLHNDLIGKVAVWMWRCKVSIEAYRTFLELVWVRNHRFIIAAAKSRRTLSYMFRYAKFPMPAEWPEVLQVWRGTSGINFNEAKVGYSWTIDRNTACWFAMRFGGCKASPLVLVANVAKSNVLLFTEERDESEVVILNSPIAEIDDAVDDWMECYERKCINNAKIGFGPLHNMST